MSTLVRSPANDRRLQRAVWRAGWIGLAGLLAWVVAGLPVLVFNEGDRLPAHADVAMVLGPVTPQRVATAEALLQSGRVDAMLWSIPSDQGLTAETTASCGSDPRLTCFDPDPSTTEGEARTLRDEAAAHGWHSAIVITMTPHLARAKSILAQCFPGSITMRPSGESPAGGWAYQYLYQTFATVKAWFRPGC